MIPYSACTTDCSYSRDLLMLIGRKYHGFLGDPSNSLGSSELNDDDLEV